MLLASGLLVKEEVAEILKSYDTDRDGRFDRPEFMDIPQYCLPLPCGDLNFSKPEVQAKNFAPVMKGLTSQMLPGPDAAAVICQTGYRGVGSITCSSETRELDLSKAFCSPNRCLDPPRAVVASLSGCTTGCADATA